MSSVLPSQTPPLLLTKRLSAFLRANANPQLPTLLLTTTSGKLLAHASPLPVAQLRTHATVAASLLAIHTASPAAIAAALPDGADAGDGDGDEVEAGKEEAGLQRRTQGQGQSKSLGAQKKIVKPATITVQLTNGTLIVRRLKCGLLFVCIGPPANSPPSTSLDQQHDNGASSTLNPSDIQNLTIASSSPSEVDSLASAGGHTTSSMESATGSSLAVARMRKQVAGLAKWLDDKLGTLKVPEDGVGHGLGLD